jgi:hypothetical protein
MIKVSLEFAPGTGEVAKELAQKLPAGAMLQAYRQAKRALGSSDIVLVIADHDPEGFDAMTRAEYKKRALGRNTKKQLDKLPIANATAHQIMKLPEDSNAFWLVIESRTHGPVACVIGAVQFQTQASLEN